VIIDWDDYWTDTHQLVPLYNNWLIKKYLKFCEYKLQKKARYATATSDFLINELKNIDVKNRFKIINGVGKDQFMLMDKDKTRKKLKEKLSLYMGAADCILFAMGNTTLEKACFPTRIGTFLNGKRIIVANDTDTEACNILKQYQCAIVGKDPEDIAKRVIGIFYDKVQKNIENNVKKVPKNPRFSYFFIF